MVFDRLASEKSYQTALARFRNADLRHSLWQLANTFVPFVLIWFLMYQSLAYSYWLTLLLAPLAAGFQLRIFIIFHDCGHNAFFKSRQANVIVGFICGVVSFTPYYHWRHFHAIHHATTGNLNRRVDGDILPMKIEKYTQNNGDVLTLTVNEYRQLSASERRIYHLYRQPALFLILVPLLLFLVVHRFANPRAARREKHSVYWTNLALGSLLLSLGLLLGFGPLLIIELPILLLSSTVGVWLFYIQHQFEETYWQEEGDWNYTSAALQGSSYYRLPRVLQWFSGNIGFHHLHHLNPRIPNYNLQKCHEASPLFQQAKVLTMRDGLKSIKSKRDIFPTVGRRSSENGWFQVVQRLKPGKGTNQVKIVKG